MPAKASQSCERQKRRQSFPEKGVIRGEAAGKNKDSSWCTDTRQADMHTFSNAQCWSIYYCICLFSLLSFHFLHHHLSTLNQQKEIKHWLLHPFLSSQDLQCHLQNGGVHLPSHWHGRRVPLLLIKLRASRLVPAWLN